MIPPQSHLNPPFKLLKEKYNYNLKLIYILSIYIKLNIDLAKFHTVCDLFNIHTAHNTPEKIYYLIKINIYSLDTIYTNFSF